MRAEGAERLLDLGLLPCLRLLPLDLQAPLLNQLLHGLRLLALLALAPTVAGRLLVQPRVPGAPVTSLE